MTSLNWNGLSEMEKKFLGYTPHRWVVVNLTEHRVTVQKVLAGWHGGYLDSDEWRISSGITMIETFADRYEFHNYSGSVYICRKDAYGLTNLSSNIFDCYTKLIEEIGGRMTIAPEFEDLPTETIAPNVA